MTKTWARILQGFSLFISLVSWLAMLVMPYFEGRSNSIWAVPPMLPALVVPLLFLLINCIFSFCYCVRTIFTKRHAIAATLMFLTSLALLIASFRLDHGNVYLRGFRDYAATILTPDEWREIDRFARERIKQDGPLAGPEKGLWDDDHRRELWSELTAATPIKKLPLPYLVIYFDARGTTVEWGGALVGHRMITIFEDAGEQYELGRVERKMSVAHDIVVALTD